MKATGESVRLSIRFWDGAWPEVGDILRTGTGRLYGVDQVRTDRYCKRIVLLVCTVLPPDAAIAGARVFPLVWTRRERRKR